MSREGTFEQPLPDSNDQSSISVSDDRNDYCIIEDAEGPHEEPELLSVPIPNYLCDPEVEVAYKIGFE